MAEKTQKELIIEYMQKYPQPLAVHEFSIMNVSQNSIASRLPELAVEGKVTSRNRIDKSGKRCAFKEWYLIKDKQPELKF